MPITIKNPLHFIGLGRSPQYSPNSVSRDSAILFAVAEQLYLSGHHVQIFHEDNWPKHTMPHAHIFSMARLPQTLQRLDTITNVHSCLNLPQGVKLCSARAELIDRLAVEGIPQPAYHIIDLDKPIPWAELPTFPLWAKRAEGYSQQSTDVVFVPEANALEAALEPLRQTGCQHVVLSQHIEGDLIKFYGVANTPFFHIAYATREGSFSKFGWEMQNAKPQHYTFDERFMSQQLRDFGAHHGVYMFGGDAIVTANGAWYVIDFNDWPSYAVCREAAAQAIATLLLDNAYQTPQL
ncbi:MAG: hypothetical protein Q4A44_02435 [Bacteroidales bacterium]|nr:hypothetical protein [Bacteroidales bacterium]